MFKMYINTNVIIGLFLMTVSLTGVRLSSNCESWPRPSAPSVPAEGIIGQAATFPWLGVLKIYLREVGSVSVAITGIVLVRPEFALASAADVARVPRRIFRRDSKAMFIPKEAQPWHCRPTDYIAHTEYDRTENTIALVHLDPRGWGAQEQRGVFPMSPVCWPTSPPPSPSLSPPPSPLDTADELYVAGFTDENGPLEKCLYKANYLDLQSCKEFYTRAKLTESEARPARYHCASAANVRESCVWDHGMVLLSNATGYWVLIGFGVLGPGCASPARFLDLASRRRWVEGTTTGRGRADAGTIPDTDTVAATRRGKGDIQYFDEDSHNSRRKLSNNERYENWFAGLDYHPTLVLPNHWKWKERFPASSPRDLLTSWDYPPGAGALYTDDYMIDRLDKDAVQVTKISGQHGDCGADSNRLIYRDETRIDAPLDLQPHRTRFAVYKISLYDLNFLDYSCVILKVKSPSKEQAWLYYRPVIETADESSGAAGAMFAHKTPEHLIKTYSLVPPGSRPTQPGGGWRPGPHLRPETVRDDADRSQRNLNLYVRFAFHESASFVIKVFGPPLAAAAPTATTPGPQRYTPPRS